MRHNDKVWQLAKLISSSLKSHLHSQVHSPSHLPTPLPNAHLQLVQLARCPTGIRAANSPLHKGQQQLTYVHSYPCHVCTSVLLFQAVVHTCSLKHSVLRVLLTSHEDITPPFRHAKHDNRQSTQLCEPATVSSRVLRRIASFRCVEVNKPSKSSVVSGHPPAYSPIALTTNPCTWSYQQDSETTAWPKGQVRWLPTQSMLPKALPYLAESPKVPLFRTRQRHQPNKNGSLLSSSMLISLGVTHAVVMHGHNPHLSHLFSSAHRIFSSLPCCWAWPYTMHSGCG